MTKESLSVKDLNARQFAAKGFEFELEYPKGKGLGVYLTILGDQAKKVEDFEVDLADARMQEAANSLDSGKRTVRSSRRIIADNLERALARIIGWRGLDEPFNEDVARELLANNPDFVDQILLESRTRANFTKA